MTVAAQFRESMALLASAVYVITGRDPLGRPRGFTATSVARHGDDPASVVVSIDRSALSHDVIGGGSHFGISLLASDQEEVAELFATKRTDKFTRVGWSETPYGLPVLHDVAAQVECRVVRVTRHLDHTLVVGVVEWEAVPRHEEALVYWDRRYHRGPPAEEEPPTPTHRRSPMHVARPGLEELATRARDLLPAIRKRAEGAEEARAVPTETIDELRSVGLLRIHQPARFGGFEMDWGAQIELARILGRACGSTAWLLAVLSTHSAMVGRFDAAAQEDVWGDDENALVATGSARITGKAVPVEGGFLVDGAWRFASGVDHSAWTIVPAPEEGIEVEGPAALRQCLVPAAEYRIVDDWHVAGLRATGSKQVAIDQPVFVPAHRTVGFLEMLGAHPPGASEAKSYVYRMEFGPYFGTILLGPVLGMAEGALEDYLEITRLRIGAVRGNRVARAEPVQLRVAESAAQIAASGLLVERMLAVLHGRGARDEFLTPRERVESMRDRAYATRTCVDAVHRLVRQMGATGLGDDNPVQRQFRDISAAAGQIGLNWDRNAGAYGKWALGVPTGDAAIDGEVPASQEDPADSIA